MESVEAAADLGNLSEELREAGAPGSARANPVALEVRVNATGARPSQGTEKRELFTEDTQTAVVFPDGAVIALTAAVIPGQLVFLTNKQNNREVVCQVIRKRNNRPTSCYVELQFTEPQTDFWGVTFPEQPQQTPQETPANPLEPLQVDAVSAEPTEEPAAEPVAAPKTEEVDSLRQEVEALREQLKALTESKKKEEEEAAAKAAEAVKKAEEEAASQAAAVRKAQEEADAAIAALAAKRDAAAAKPSLIRMTLPAAPVATDPSLAALPKLPVPQPSPQCQPLQAPPPTKPLSPPESSVHSAERDAFEDLLPKPELDFSNAPIPGEDDRYNIYKPLRKKVGLRDIILTIAATLLLAGGIGFAWYKDKLPMARRNAQAPAATAKSASAPKPATPPSAQAKALAPSATPSVASNPPATQPTDAKAAEATAAPAEESAKSLAGNESATEAPVATKKTAAAAPTTSAKKRKTQLPPTPAVPPPDPVAPDAPVLAPKLTHAAKPVYPPDAMRNFITGDVRISAEVGADGHVGKVTVISGPAALRAAAIEAMKQYEYEPATKGGKPIPSQVTTTIKFWFDP
jgi:periplasmic protein TonB